MNKWIFGLQPLVNIIEIYRQKLPFLWNRLYLVPWRLEPPVRGRLRVAGGAVAGGEGGRRREHLAPVRNVHPTTAEKKKIIIK